MKIFRQTENFLINFLNINIENRNNSEIFNTKKLKKKIKYQNQIKEILNGERFLFILDLDEVESYFPNEVKNLFYSNTLRFLKILKKTIDILAKKQETKTTREIENFSEISNRKKIDLGIDLKELSFLEKKKIWYQIIIKPPTRMKLNRLNSVGARLIGKFTMVKGLVIKIDETFYLTKKAVYNCLNCGGTFIKEKIQENLKIFLFCQNEKCKSEKIKRKLFFNTKQSVFENFQEVKIQQKSHQKGLSDFAGSLKIRLFGKFTNICILGEFIKVAGILLPDIDTESFLKNNKEEIYLKTLYLERFFSPRKFLGDKKKKEILDIFKDPEIYSRVSFSLAPSIYGFWDVKKAAVLSLLTSNSVGFDSNSKTRDSVNLFFTSSSGAGKSSFLREISGLGDPGIFFNSLSSLKINLERFAWKNVKTNQNESINKKIFPLKGVIFLDDIFGFERKKGRVTMDLFDTTKPNQNQSNFLQEASKFYSIIAATSIGDFFLFYLKGNFSLNQIFSRFDLCFLSDNYRNFEFDYNLANHITSLYQRGEVETSFKIIKKETLRIFFLEAMKINPSFPDNLFDLIVYTYLVIRVQNSKLGKGFIGGTLFSLFRLSKALARLRFHRKVSDFDLHEASRLIGKSIRSLEILEQKKSSNEQTKQRRKIYEAIRNLSIKKKKLTIKLLFLENFFSRKGFSRQNLVDCLGHYEDLNVWTININRGELVFII